MSASLDLNVNQINQALNASYSGLVSAGTGIVRLTGDQQISGIKTFKDSVYLSGLSNLPSVSQISPTGNASIDLGSSSNRFRTGYFSGVTGFTGYFEYLKVGNLDASVTVNLDNKTGNNLTINGQTNVQNLAVSGNQAIASGLTVSGGLNVSGNAILNGTITATGSKSFSGILNQSGNVNIFGAESVSGNLRVTGDIYCTGNFSANGNINFTGGYAQTGAFFVNSNNNGIVFTGAGASHKFSVFGPMSLNGVIYHSGTIIHTGDFYNTGNFANTGSFTNVGDSTISGNQTVTGSVSSNKVLTSGIVSSGTSTIPAVVIGNNLTSSPSGGAIEYNKRAFFISSEATGAPTRSLVNQTFSYLAPQNFYAASPAANSIIPLLGNTGIYLNTGLYHIKYDIKFNKTLAEPISLGISGDNSNIVYRVGHLTSNVTTAAIERTGFFGNNQTNNILATGTSLGANSLNFYSFEASIVITGLMKIRPVFRIIASELITGSAFSMQVTQLATGTGIGLVGSNGPWSAA
jgi:cytoskeletal protein CcmA (bactofilin family)